MIVSFHQINTALEPYSICLSRQQGAAVQLYIDLLLLWNQKINLTTVCDPTEILQRHFGESMFAAQQVPISDGRLADVGSGAGFPAIPLKIFRPSLSITMIEPNAKKVAFLSEVKRQLSIAAVEILRGRFEDLRREVANMDFITARALGRRGPFLRCVKEALCATGKIVLWLGADDAETLRRSADWIWQEPIKIPCSRKRVLLIGRVATHS